MTGLKAKILTAARADSIPEGWSGLWYIRKGHVPPGHISIWEGNPVSVPAGTYTHLFRVTDETLYYTPPGLVVMEDTPFELSTHLDFMLKASGRVLVTGLGLGCVVRGLLANPAVKHVTCIERSTDVLKLVAPHMPKSRLTIVQADALEWSQTNSQEFDCAWHDLWTNREDGEPHLDYWHTRLMIDCSKHVKRQGAWRMARTVKRLLSKRIDIIG